MPYGNLLADVVQGSTANTPPVFKDGNSTEIGTLCRAWVNFNGTGTVAIRASFNVSSITDGGAGIYTVNFTNAMPDVNYATLVTSSVDANTSDSAMNNNFVTTTSVRVQSMTAAGANTDSTCVNVAVFR
jgi:hypothetical protein